MKHPRIGHVLAVSLVLLAVITAPAHASIVLDRTEVIIAADVERETITVTNTRDTPAFVSIAAREILNPGRQPEESNKGPDPRAVGLLAAPTRLALAPRERRTVRLQFLDPARDRDRVWRVTVQEVSGPVTMESSGLVLLIGYDVLVIQRPTTPTPSIAVKRDGKQLSVTNSGNSFAILDDGKQCTGADPASCADVVGARIYPGQTRELTAPDATAAIRFKLKLPAGDQDVRY